MEQALEGERPAETRAWQRTSTSASSGSLLSFWFSILKAGVCEA